MEIVKKIKCKVRKSNNSIISNWNLPMMSFKLSYVAYLQDFSQILHNFKEVMKAAISTFDHKKESSFIQPPSLQLSILSGLFIIRLSRVQQIVITFTMRARYKLIGSHSSQATIIKILAKIGQIRTINRNKLSHQLTTSQRYYKMRILTKVTIWYKWEAKRQNLSYLRQMSWVWKM